MRVLAQVTMLPEGTFVTFSSGTLTIPLPWPQRSSPVVIQPQRGGPFDNVAFALPFGTPSPESIAGALLTPKYAPLGFFTTTPGVNAYGIQSSYGPVIVSDDSLVWWNNEVIDVAAMGGFGVPR